MDKIVIKKHIIKTLSDVTGKRISNLDKNLFSKDLDFAPREVAYALMQLQDDLNVDLNPLAKSDCDMSINRIADVLCS